MQRTASPNVSHLCSCQTCGVKLCFARVRNNKRCLTCGEELGGCRNAKPKLLLQPHFSSWAEASAAPYSTAFFFSSLSAKAFSTLYLSFTARHRVNLSYSPLLTVTQSYYWPAQTEWNAMPFFFFFFLPQHWFYSKGELTSWFGPGLDFLNNLSPPLLYTWHTDSLPI